MRSLAGRFNGRFMRQDRHVRSRVAKARPVIQIAAMQQDMDQRTTISPRSPPRSSRPRHAGGKSRRFRRAPADCRNAKPIASSAALDRLRQARAKSRSAARSASPTATSGRNTASTRRTGAMSRSQRARALCAPAIPLGDFAEPRIEPEIVFGLSAAPSPDMDEAALMDCIDWVAHGYEIVQSIFPRWKFKPEDTVAAQCDAWRAADRRAPCLQAARGGMAAKNGELRNRSLPQWRHGRQRPRRQCPRQPAAGACAIWSAAGEDPVNPPLAGRRDRLDRHADPRAAGRARRNVDDQGARNSVGRRVAACFARPRPRSRTSRRRAPRARPCRPRPRTGRR